MLAEGSDVRRGHGIPVRLEEGLTVILGGYNTVVIDLLGRLLGRR